MYFGFALHCDANRRQSNHLIENKSDGAGCFPLRVLFFDFSGV